MKPPKQLSRFATVGRLKRLSADGDNLVAVDDTGRVFYTKLETLEWTDVWGPTGGTGPLFVDASLAQVAMSHRAVPYTDVDGNAHPISAGVTTFYALAQGGNRLTFADPWLPPRFAHEVCLPLHGRFIAQSLAASASTLFVMDDAGRAFTRLIDFDTAGSDPALAYSYEHEVRTGFKEAIGVRTLPAEDWREQPKIPGVHSTRITLKQTGATNADRELRVEGEGGTWTKALEAPAWSFVETGQKMEGAPVKAEPAALAPSRTETLEASALFQGAQVTLSDFDERCAPARLTLTQGGETLALPLHFDEGLLAGTRQQKGAVLVPAGDGPLHQKFQRWASPGTSLRVRVTTDADQVVVAHEAALPKFHLRFPRPKTR